MLLHDDNVSRKGRQALGASLTDQHIVLNPHADFAHTVDTRLNGEDHTRLQYAFVPDHDVRRLMRLHAQPMTRPVADEMLVAGVNEDLARRNVN